MRAIQDAMQELRSEHFHGRVNIYSAGVITTAYVIPALNELRKRWPTLLPVLGGEAKLIVSQLLSGQLDLAFHSYQIADTKLEGTHLGSVSSGVYCGEGHPLHRRRKITLEELLTHEFVAPAPDAMGQHVDGWPSHIPRKFGMHIDQMRVGRDVCAAGSLLAVLPDPIAAGAHYEKRLHRLPIEEDVLPPTKLFATYRPPLAEQGPAHAIVESVRKRIEADTRKARGTGMR